MKKFGFVFTLVFAVCCAGVFAYTPEENKKINQVNDNDNGGN